MLRLAISRNLQILPKTLGPFTSKTVNGLSNRLNPSASVAIKHRLFSLSTVRLCEAQAGDGDGEGEKIPDTGGLDESMFTDRVYKPHLDRRYRRLIGTDRDRTIPIPYETSVEYLQSSAYKTTYGDEPVWVKYRRVFGGGQFPKFRTRKTCTTPFHKYILIWNSSPCPICRDKYLVLHELNVDLLKQFISPYTGEILSFSKTNICQAQHLKLRVCIERAFDMGLLQLNVPFREFNYADYYDLNTRSNIVHLKKSNEF